MVYTSEFLKAEPNACNDHIYHFHALEFAEPCSGRVRSWPITFKIEQDTDRTSVWSNNRTRNKHNNSRTEATTLQLLVFLLNSCLLLLLLVQLLFITQTIFDFRGAVREPWDMTVSTCFTFRGYLFSACFLALIFSTKNDFCCQLDPKKWNRWRRSCPRAPWQLP